MQLIQFAQFSAFLNVHKILNTLKKKYEPKRLLSFKIKNCKMRPYLKA